MTLLRTTPSGTSAGTQSACGCAPHDMLCLQQAVVQPTTQTCPAVAGLQIWMVEWLMPSERT